MKRIISRSLGVGLIISIAVITSGCSHMKNLPKLPSPEMVHDKSKQAGKVIIRIPELNQIKTIEVGANIYQKINEYRYDTYDVTIIRPHGITDKEWEESDLNEEIIANRLNRFLYKWSEKGLNAVCRNDESSCWIDLNNTNQFTFELDKGDVELDNLGDDDTVPYKLTPTPPTYGEDSFKYEALYQGKIGNKIKIQFREFVQPVSNIDNSFMIRPAFTQDIEYELDKNGEAIIGFKGLRVKVIKATNMDITYSVIQDYN